MTTKQLTLTLSRWHIVADRLNAKVKELESRALSTFNSTVVSSFQDQEQVQTLNLRSTQAQAEVDFARRLIATVGTIREALARANAQHGVSAQLSRLEAINRDIRLLGLFAGVDNDSKVRTDRLEAHFQALNGAEGIRSRLSSGVSVVMLPDAKQSAYQEQRETLQAQAHALSDEINELNRHTVMLSVDEDVARIAGM